MTVPSWLKASLASVSLGAIVGAVAMAMLIGGECSAWKADHPKPAKPTPTVLAPTPAELATPKETVCAPVQVLQPSPKRAKEIAKATGRPAPVTIQGPGASSPVSPEIVAPTAFQLDLSAYPLLLADARPYPDSPAGGVIYSWLEADGSNTLVAVPNPEKRKPEDKFLQFGNIWEVGAAYGLGQGGDTRGRGWAAIEPLRLGRIHLRAEAGVDLRGGVSETYILAGAVFRSR